MSNVYVKIWPAGNVPDDEWEAFLSHLIEGVENASVNLRARHGVRLDSHPVIVGEKFAVFELCALKPSIVGAARHLRGISRYMLEKNPSLKLYQCGSRLLFYDFMDHITKKPEDKAYINGQRYSLKRTLKMVRDRIDGLPYQLEDLYKQDKTPHYAEGLCTAFAIVEAYLADELSKLEKGEKKRV